MSIFKSNYPEVKVPEHSLFDHVFEGIQTASDKTAYVDGFDPTRSYTFIQIYGAVKKVATGLSKLGFKKGDVLGIYSPNLMEYAVFFHAVGYIGASVTPANPLFTEDELALQLKDAGAKFLITVPPLLAKAKDAAAKSGIDSEFVYVFGQAEGAHAFAELLNNDGSQPQAEINPKKDIIVIPYSSGTSGLPKGVLLTHHNLVSNLCQAGFIEDPFINENDIFVGLLPFFHIYGLLLIMQYAFMRRIKVVVMPRFDLVKFLEIVQTHKVTVAHIVPPIILALAKHPVVANYDLSSLKQLFSGAAPLSPELEEAAEKRLNLVVRQAYGMTELSPGANITPTNRIKKGSVGPLLPNLEAKIVNVDSGALCGINEEGELRLRGPNVMQGYLKNEEANKLIFDEDGFMRTGDICKVDEDGYYYIVDRLKELIKYKGHQLAPAELEGLLISHPAIADACVIPVPDEEAGELAKGFVVLKQGQTATAEEIQQFIQSKVNPHKYLRGGVEFIDAIPKSATGKILRRVLRDKEKHKKQHEQAAKIAAANN